MATLRLLMFIFFSLSAWAMSPEERAMILNEEMDFLLKSAPKVQVWAAPDSDVSPSMRTRRNGVAPTQMPEIENLENRYFSDDVSFQAASSDRINDVMDSGDDYVQGPEEASDYRVDGSVPKKRR